MMMKKKRVWLAMLASVSFATVASATPVVLDDWTAMQTVTATSTNPTVSNLLAAPVSGAASFLGNRTLTASFTSGDVGDGVNAIIGAGKFKCNRDESAQGFCSASYTTLVDFVLGAVDFNAVSDGAFGGSASVDFYKGGLLLANQAIAVGSSAYSVFMGNTDFAVGDIFTIRLNGTVATDESLRVVTNEVPEPGSLALTGLGLLGLGGFMRRRSLGGNSTTLA